jgi:hypothetical protein
MVYTNKLLKYLYNLEGDSRNSAQATFTYFRGTETLISTENVTRNSKSSVNTENVISNSDFGYYRKCYL